MRPRQSILEIFSTFLQFDADRCSGWATESKLHRSMQNCLARLPQSDAENFWILYWYKIWQIQPAGLAREHLSAYLQETCYWAAQKMSTSFTNAQYGLSDYFQMAIARVDKVLKGFNPRQGFSLKNYASTTFSSVIKDILLQRHETDFCTHWALLRKLSQKRLVEALQSAGLPSKSIDGYILAWQCFKSIYVPTQATGARKLPRPDPTTWAAITDLYNTERHHQLQLPGSACSSETLEKWLIACAKAARSYLYPAQLSINSPRPGQESGELLDNLVGEESLLTQIVVQEEEQTRQTQQTQISSVLVAALAKLNPQAQRLLKLYYVQRLTQQEIAKQLEVKQYTVSRRLTKARGTLLMTLAQWSQETLHISLSSEVLNNTSAILDEWLEHHYGHSNHLSSME